jgi:hypothetical protein
MAAARASPLFKVAAYSIRESSPFLVRAAVHYPRSRLLERRLHEYSQLQGLFLQDC